MSSRHECTHAEECWRRQWLAAGACVEATRHNLWGQNQAVLTRRACLRLLPCCQRSGGCPRRPRQRLLKLAACAAVCQVHPDNASLLFSGCCGCCGGWLQEQLRLGLRCGAQQQHGQQHCCCCCCFGAIAACWVVWVGKGGVRAALASMSGLGMARICLRAIAISVVEFLRPGFRSLE